MQKTKYILLVIFVFLFTQISFAAINPVDYYALPIPIVKNKELDDLLKKLRANNNLYSKRQKGNKPYVVDNDYLHLTIFSFKNYKQSINYLEKNNLLVNFNKDLQTIMQNINLAQLIINKKNTFNVSSFGFITLSIYHPQLINAQKNIEILCNKYNIKINPILMPHITLAKPFKYGSIQNFNNINLQNNINNYFVNLPGKIIYTDGVAKVVQTVSTDTTEKLKVISNFFNLQKNKKMKIDKNNYINKILKDLIDSIF